MDSVVYNLRPLELAASQTSTAATSVTGTAAKMIRSPLPPKGLQRSHDSLRGMAESIRTAVISTTSSSQCNRRNGEYMGALLQVAGAPVLTHLVRSLVKVGITRLVVVHADNAGEISEEMERFRQELMQSVYVDVVNAHAELNIEKGKTLSYCRGIMAARHYVAPDEPFMLVSSDHMYTRLLLRKMANRLDVMCGVRNSKKVVHRTHLHQFAQQHLQTGDLVFRSMSGEETPVLLPQAFVLCDDSRSVVANSSLLSLRLIIDERTGEISQAARNNSATSEYIRSVEGEELAQGNATDTGIFVFSSDFWPIAEKLDENGYFSIAEVLTEFIKTASKPGVPGVLAVKTNNIAWFTSENQPEGSRLVQMVEDGGWLSGRENNGEQISPDELECEDPVVEFLERKSKLAKFENSLEGIPLPVSFFYASDIRGLLWHHLQSLSREAIEEIKKEAPAVSEDGGNSGSEASDEGSTFGFTRMGPKPGTKKSCSKISKVRIVWRLLRAVQEYFAYPSKEALAHMEQMLEQGNVQLQRFYSIAVALAASVGKNEIGPSLADVLKSVDENQIHAGVSNFYALTKGTKENENDRRRYFEVLVVGKMTEREQCAFARTITDKQQPSDEFVYSFAFAESFEDAVTAVLFNRTLQSIIITDSFAIESQNALSDIQCFVSHRERAHYKKQLDNSTNSTREQMHLLTAKIKSLLPSMDVFWLSKESAISQPQDVFSFTSNKVFDVDSVPSRSFHDVVCDATELHFSIIHAIATKYHTPFFQALMDYASKPTGVFHALPVSRGNSIFHSHWLQDFGDFYGPKLFLAETSSTIGGLDSLLEPRGVIREAQTRAAKAFGANLTYFSTNGTSTANKIVLQALLSPGDIIFVDRNCHKSHHYGAVLQGASVCYLDAYKMHEYAMYGTVPLKCIVSTLQWYEKQNLLSKVKVILLTNCTFDGLVYNVRRVMERCLAIKPDLVFLWDEAWFAFARFTPTYRRRTAMHVASQLKTKYSTGEYRKDYHEHVKKYERREIPEITLPDPTKVRIRVYATQSTHKTLSALRQGSMVHVHDEDFRTKVEQAFHEAYMTHTSTSPNYQIIASLDVARRQVEMEGFDLVQKSVEKAMMLRMSTQEHPLIRKYFKFLDTEEMIPAQMRDKGTPLTCLSHGGFSGLDESWAFDEVTLDPTRLTLLIRATGFNGDSFKKMLMDEHGIQVNKTSINTVLFMTNIGTTSSAVSHLSNSLLKIAHQLETQSVESNVFERALHFKQIKKCLPPLPDFSYWHPKFVRKEFDASNLEDRHKMTGSVREAYFLGVDSENIEYLLWDEIRRANCENRSVVGATFIIPYPPGFPVVVPGQVITTQIIDFMVALDVSEVHGFIEGVGVRIFKDAVLKVEGDKADAPKSQASEQVAIDEPE
eukprot:GEMP01002154.1.p1 GENE.GEMP01002154.1~~GEMP01002154.1.p1  ORF type:complete len:1396 (+),score=278.09 GEMP01002154.1:90-4277(+)